jgi:hypothetical protein
MALVAVAAVQAMELEVAAVDSVQMPLVKLLVAVLLQKLLFQ